MKLITGIITGVVVFLGFWWTVFLGVMTVLQVIGVI